MENQIINLEPAKAKSWEENDNFAKAKATASKVVDEGKDVVGKVADAVKETAEMVKNESKLIAPDVVDVVKESKARLDSEKRIIEVVPNSLLYFALTGLGIVFIIKLLK